MKKIRIKICNFNGVGLEDESHYGNFILKILQKNYEVEFTENPDYIFYHESSTEYLKYDCIRIFWTGENVSPNFNLCDYAVGFDWLDFQDRYYRFPIYLVSQFYRDQELAEIAGNDFSVAKVVTAEDLAEKTDFCSFVYSNYLGDDSRRSMFEKLSSYKKVNAGGAYLNNIGGRTDNKLAFERRHKFSIAFENSSRSGYTTEKLPNAIVAGTVPIYWGNPDIAKEFNEERFINCHRYDSFEAVVEKVKEIDQDDELYLSMLNQPVKNERYDFDRVKDGLEVFLKNIFDQPLSKASRRMINAARAKDMERNERLAAKLVMAKNQIKKLLAKAYQPLKKNSFFEKIKQDILKRF